MARKSIISLSLFLAMCASVTCAMANSTVYTDDLGRIHFLGKDSGSKTLQQVSDFRNPSEMYINNGEMIKGASQDVINTPPNAGYEQRYKYRNLNSSDIQERMNRSKGSFTYEKGAMDASNPYTYGETNLKNAETKSATTTEEKTTTKKKHFWDNW